MTHAAYVGVAGYSNAQLHATVCDSQTRCDRQVLSGMQLTNDNHELAIKYARLWYCRNAAAMAVCRGAADKVHTLYAGFHLSVLWQQSHPAQHTHKAQDHHASAHPCCLQFLAHRSCKAILMSTVLTSLCLLCTLSRA